MSESGTLPVFNLKQKPVQAPCAVCDIAVGGVDLVPSPWGFICRTCCDVCETQTGVPWEMIKMAAQKEWVVKANTKIIGPYTAEEVENLLRDNRIVPHDEIIRPAGRWHILRDEEQFRLVLNEVRNRAQNKREKSLENTASGTMTPTLEDMVAERAFETGNLLDDFTPTRVKEVPPARETPGTRDLMKSFASRDDSKLKTEFQALQKKRTWAALFLLLVSGVFVALQLTRPRGGNANERAQAFQSLMENGLRAEKVGDYSKAFSRYSEARMIKPNDSELLLHLAPLTLFYERQLLQAQSMFEQILKNETELNYQKSSYIGLGLIALDDHDLDKARAYFLKARALDSDYLPAIMNLGVVAYLKDDFNQAKDLLSAALNKGGSDGAIVITMADIIVGLFSTDSKGERGELQRAGSLLGVYLTVAKDYEQEALVEYARILSLLDQDTKTLDKIEQFLDIDPEQTDLHVRDWQIYRGRVSWGMLLASLKKVAAGLSSNPRVTAALGLAMYREKEKLEGANNIEQAFSQSQDDPLLMALAGWVELKLGHRENAVVNIKRAALINTKYKLPHIMQARLCVEDKEWDCSKKHWEEVLKLDARSAEALHGLAEVAWNKKDRALANVYMSQLYANDPNYIPYLQLVQEMQKNEQSGASQ